MTREVRRLREKAINSLVLAVEYFNRPWDRGRAEAVFLMLSHSLEMLLKAAILHRGGEIRKPQERRTIGFDVCVRRAVSNAQVKFLRQEQAITLQAINGQRDAAQHYLVDVSERQLYIYAQGGLPCSVTFTTMSSTIDYRSSCLREYSRLRRPPR